MKPSRLFIDSSVASLPIVKQLQARLNLDARIVDDAREVIQALGNAADPVKEGKRLLFLTRNKGRFIKDCPGTGKYTCCGYRILHIGTFCTMDCSYCILQSYFHPPFLQLFVNTDDMMAQLDDVLAQNTIQRIGTGEFTDSMIWEHLTPLSGHLVAKFATQSRAVLELKTKTAVVSSLKNLRHHRKTIVSWSLNTPRIIGTQEKGTASLGARLKAATACESWGYPLGFHFDPLILYEGCEEEYRTVIDRLFSSISADNVVWISLGAFRFMPGLKPIIANRFPRSKIIYGEFIPGLDRKMRYFKPLRLNLYRKLAAWIGECAPRTQVYFCMEDDEVLEKALGVVPSRKGGLARMLDASAAAHCGLSAV